MDSEQSTKISQKHTVSIFRDQDGDTKLLQNFDDIYLQVYSASPSKMS